MSTRQLALGTAQFGLSYGISNTAGKTSLHEAKKILEIAHDHGMHVIDTACLYGDSEQVLGKILPTNHSFKIVTKIPFLSSISGSKKLHLKKNFYESLKRLRQEKLHALLFHNADDVFLPEGEKLFSVLQDFKKEGLVEKIGFSVYNSQQIDKILDFFDFDLIQLPCNVFDQRLIASGHLKKLKRANVEIHARSVFLQGLLLMKPTSISSYFDPIKNNLHKYHQALETKCVSAQQAALSFVRDLKEIDHIVLGVNNAEQLLENIEAYEKQATLDFSPFACRDEKFINPIFWNKEK